MSNLANSGECLIEKAVIVTFSGQEYDISSLIVSYAISESIHRQSMDVSVTLIDTVGLLENVPLIGEETLNFSIKSMDFETQLEMILAVYQIADVVPMENQSGLRYTLRCVSVPTFVASSKIITRSYDTPISEIVRDLFNENFVELKEDPMDFENANVFNLSSKRKFYCERTTGDIRCVLPTYRTHKCLSFLSSRAYSDKSTSCSFKFFETKHGFFFCTDEFLIRKSSQSETKKFFWDQSVVISPLNSHRAKEKLLTFSNTKRVDSASDLYHGAFKSKVVVVDMLSSTSNELNFDLDDENFEFLDEDSAKIHSEDFKNEFFTEENKHQMLFFKDHDTNNNGQLRGEQYIPEIAVRRKAYEYLISQKVVSATIQGRLDVSAGDVVEITVNELQSIDVRDSNPSLSGKYILSDVAHSVEGRQLKTNMKLIKVGSNKNV